MEFKITQRLATFRPTKWAANLVTNPRLTWKASRGTINGEELFSLAQKFHNKAMFSRPWGKSGDTGRPSSQLFSFKGLIKNVALLGVNILPQSVALAAIDRSVRISGPSADLANASSWGALGGFLTFFAGHGMFQVGRLAGSLIVMERAQSEDLAGSFVRVGETFGEKYQGFLLNVLRSKNAEKADDLEKAAASRKKLNALKATMRDKAAEEAANELYEKLTAGKLAEEDLSIALAEFSDKVSSQKGEEISNLIDSLKKEAEAKKKEAEAIKEEPPVELTNANAIISGANASADEAQKILDEVSTMKGVGTQRMDARTAKEKLLNAVKSLEDEIAFGVLDENRRKVASLTEEVDKALIPFNKALKELKRVVAEEKDPVLKLKSEREDLKKQFKSIENNVKLFWKDLKPSQIKWLQQELDTIYNHLRIAKDALGDNNAKTAGAELSEARKRLNSLTEFTSSSTKAKESIPEASAPAASENIVLPPLDQTPSGPQSAFADAEISGGGGAAASSPKIPPKKEDPTETRTDMPAAAEEPKSSLPSEGPASEDKEGQGVPSKRAPSMEEPEVSFEKPATPPPPAPAAEAKPDTTQVLQPRPQMSNVERAKQAMKDMDRLRTEYQELFSELQNRLGGVPELADIIKKMEEHKNGLSLKEMKQLMIALINLRQTEKLTAVSDEALKIIIDVLKKPSDEAFGNASKQIAGHKDPLLTELLALAKTYFENIDKFPAAIARIEAGRDATVLQKDLKIRELQKADEEQKAKLESIEKYIEYYMEADFTEGAEKLSFVQWYPLYVIYNKEVSADGSGITPTFLKWYINRQGAGGQSV